MALVPLATTPALIIFPFPIGLMASLRVLHNFNLHFLNLLDKVSKRYF